MKKIFNVITVAAIIGLSISCSDNTEAEIKSTKEELKKEAHTFDEVVEQAEDKIWPANVETTQGFANMAFILSEFTDAENVEAYTQLEKDLKVEYRLIFKKCTMTGEAHDHLHHYLMPFSDIFKGLKSSDLEFCKSSFTEMKLHLADYKNHFE